MPLRPPKKYLHVTPAEGECALASRYCGPPKWGPGFSSRLGFPGRSLKLRTTLAYPFRAALGPAGPGIEFLADTMVVNLDRAVKRQHSRISFCTGPKALAALYAEGTAGRFLPEPFRDLFTSLRTEFYRSPWGGPWTVESFQPHRRLAGALGGPNPVLLPGCPGHYLAGTNPKPCENTIAHFGRFVKTPRK